MANIHPTALIDPQAELDSSVTVGAYSVIGPNVRIGAGTKIGPHVVIEGHTTIGCDNNIFQFASLGGMPQDKKYAGEPTRLEIGDRNTIREFCTLNTGSVQDQGVTSMGSDNWIMAYVHIAHDCVVGSNTIFANSTTLGGHVHVHDWAILGGGTLVHQFCQVGAHVMVGGGTILTQDLPPYVMASGRPVAPHGINSEGLRRRGFSPEQIADLRNAYKILYRSGLSLEEAKAELAKQESGTEHSAGHINLMRTFLDGVTRGIVR
ncbi:MAG: acyl-ACP--UDP-N-acetylglucosamine O-acyltransferase [Burkholderiaceae bacterium]|nr:acyl-ACP--UDP-N-acetylglucosamine O-acyltransferase [Burkholderiaceae bacterium]